MAEPRHSAEAWTVEDIVHLLNDLGLGEYAAGVRENSVSGAVLQVLTEDDLRNDLGIRSGIHRKRILLAFHKAIGATWQRSTQAVTTIDATTDQPVVSHQSIDVTQLASTAVAAPAPSPKT